MNLADALEAEPFADRFRQCSALNCESGLSARPWQKAPTKYDPGVVLDFSLRDLPGWVAVTLEPNHDPEALGKPPPAKGFPVCTAEVTYRGRGYHAALGWIQLVKSTDNSSGGRRFEMDPFEPLGRLAHPFCFFGFAPTLFDAPSRESRAPIVWTAHSFLAFIGEDGERLEARAVLGFSWGFSIDNATFAYEAPAALAPSVWDGHRAFLSDEHPSWGFADGYRDR